MRLFFLSATVVLACAGLLCAEETASLRTADGFQYPVGANGSGEGYYIARGYRPNGHLGEDWNGVRGGDTDLGDPVYATANGIVVFAKNYHVGWGNVVIIRHAYYEGSTLKYVDSLYGHLLDFKVDEGQQIRRGQLIGHIGNNGGMYDAHLHFEMRKNLTIGMFRSSFSRDFSNYWSPHDFVAAHRTCPEGNRTASVPVNTFPSAAPPLLAGPHVNTPVSGPPPAGQPSRLTLTAPPPTPVPKVPTKIATATPSPTPKKIAVAEPPVVTKSTPTPTATTPTKAASTIASTSTPTPAKNFRTTGQSATSTTGTAKSASTPAPTTATKTAKTQTTAAAKTTPSPTPAKIAKAAPTPGKNSAKATAKVTATPAPAASSAKPKTIAAATPKPAPKAPAAVAAAPATIAENKVPKAVPAATPQPEPEASKKDPRALEAALTSSSIVRDTTPIRRSGFKVDRFEDMRGKGY